MTEVRRKGSGLPKWTHGRRRAGGQRGAGSQPGVAGRRWAHGRRRAVGGVRAPDDMRTGGGRQPVRSENFMVGSQEPVGIRREAGGQVLEDG